MFRSARCVTVVALEEARTGRRTVATMVVLAIGVLRGDGRGKHSNAADATSAMRVPR